MASFTPAPFLPYADHNLIDSFYYQMRTPPYGLCVIVNNANFPFSSPSEDLYGSHFDITNIDDQFTALGFTVSVLTDLPYGKYIK